MKSNQVCDSIFLDLPVNDEYEFPVLEGEVARVAMVTAGLGGSHLPWGKLNKQTHAHTQVTLVRYSTGIQTQKVMRREITPARLQHT